MHRYENKIVIILFFLIVSCSVLHDDRLSGVFVSDQQTTLTYLRNTGNYTAEHLSRISQLLGKMQITYKNNNIAIVEFDGKTHQDKFKVIEIFPDYTTIEYDQCSQYKIIFEDDGYWAIGGIMPPPYREKFKKIK